LEIFLGVRQSLVRAFLKLNIFARTPKIEKSTSLRLSKEDAEKLWEALESPPNEALKKAKKNYEEYSLFDFKD